MTRLRYAEVRICVLPCLAAAAMPYNAMRCRARATLLHKARRRAARQLARIVWDGLGSRDAGAQETARPHAPRRQPRQSMLHGR